MDEDNVYKQLRESTETDQSSSITQSELASIFSKEGNPLSQSVISKLESNTKKPPSTSIDVLKAYTQHFHVTSDYLLGLSENKYADENYQMITRTIGLSDESINTLKKIHSGNATDDFFDTLNFLISKDFGLFIRFIDAIELYFDESFDTSMTFEKNRAVPINVGDNSSILYKEENEILIGSYDQKLCNGDGGYRIRGIPISIIKKGYSMQAIQLILEELKREKKESD